MAQGNHFDGGLGVLAIWQEITGVVLDEKQRHEFLTRKEVPTLAVVRVADLMKAGRQCGRPGYLKLRSWLAQVEWRPPKPEPLRAAVETSAKRYSPMKRRGRSSSAGSGAPKVRHDPNSGGHHPHQPADADLHKKIGPTQKYDDSF